MTDTSPGHEPTASPTTPKTLRQGLRDRRQQAQSKLHLDRRVPRLDPPVFVRFRPLSQDELEAAQKAIEKGKAKDRTVVANANALATACIGIYELDAQGEKTSAAPDDVEDWNNVRFDENLGRELGHESMIRASDVVRALYLTEGDIVHEAGELTTWSGWANDDEAEAWSGN